MTYKKPVGMILLLLASVVMRAQGNFVIEGKAKNMKEGVCLRLFRMEGGIGHGIAVDTLRGDSFRFEQQTSGEGTDKLLLMITEGNLHTMALELWAQVMVLVSLTYLRKSPGLTKRTLHPWS